MNIDKSVIIQIKKRSIEIEKLSNKLLKPYNLTHTQFTIMKYLYQKLPSVISQIDIERHFSLTNPTVTGVIQNLEKKGMIERVANPQDSRSKIITLTAKAEAIKDDLIKFGDNLENQVTEGFSEEEKQQLIMLLKKLRV